MITPTQHEKDEWSRLASYAYNNDSNDYGHKFSGLASLRNGESIDVATFDDAQATYRTWLLFGKLK